MLIDKTVSDGMIEPGRTGHRSELSSETPHYYAAVKTPDKGVLVVS